MYIILSFFGVLYILNMINRNAYKFLPKLNISSFFANKLEIYQITCVKDYILAWLKIHRGVNGIKNINDADISKFDAEALEELKQYINSELKQYIKKTATKHIPMLEQFNCHIQSTLRHGIVDFYLSQNNLFMDIKVKFQSISEDCPTLEISSKAISYTYRLKSKHIRFVNPNVKLIYEIRDSLKSLNQSFLQVA